MQTSAASSEHVEIVANMTAMCLISANGGIEGIGGGQKNVCQKVKDYQIKCSHSLSTSYFGGFCMI